MGDPVVTLRILSVQVHEWRFKEPHQSEIQTQNMD